MLANAVKTLNYNNPKLLNNIEILSKIYELNNLGCQFLEKKEIEKCFDMLKKAEMMIIELIGDENNQLVDHDKYELDTLKAILMNNIGCNFACKKKYSASVSYFNHAKDVNGVISKKIMMIKAISTLNLSGAYNKLQQHKKGLFYAQQAEQFITTRTLGYSFLSSNHNDLNNGINRSRIEKKDDNHNDQNCKILLLADDSCISSYNAHSIPAYCNYYMGLNYEEMDRISEAYLSYKKGLNLLVKLNENSIWNVKFNKRIMQLRDTLKTTNPYLDQIFLSMPNYNRPERHTMKSNLLDRGKANIQEIQHLKQGFQNTSLNHLQNGQNNEDSRNHGKLNNTTNLILPELIESKKEIGRLSVKDLKESKNSANLDCSTTTTSITFNPSKPVQYRTKAFSRYTSTKEEVKKLNAYNFYGIDYQSPSFPQKRKKMNFKIRSISNTRGMARTHNITSLNFINLDKYISNPHEKTNILTQEYEASNFSVKTSLPINDGKIVETPISYSAYFPIATKNQIMNNNDHNNNINNDLESTTSLKGNFVDLMIQNITKSFENITQRLCYYQNIHIKLAEQLKMIESRSFGF